MKESNTKLSIQRKQIVEQSLHIEMNLDINKPKNVAKIKQNHLFSF